jgi:golgi phosphoprotein 3
VIAELSMRGRVVVDEGKKITVVDTDSTGDELLDESLVILAQSERKRKVTHWIYELAGKKLQKRIFKQLVAKGVVREEERRFLWMIPYKTFSEKDASAKYWVKERLRGIVLANEKAEQHDVVLLSLMKTSRLSNLLFTKDERKAAIQRVNQLVKGEVFGEAVARTIEEVEAAVIAATLSATS